MAASKQTRTGDGITQLRDKAGKLTNRFQVRYDLLDAEGKRIKQKSETFEGTRKQAEAFKAQRMQEQQKGTYIEPTDQTVAQWVEHWLEAFAQGKQTAGTFETTSTSIRRYVIPRLGKVKLRNLTTGHLQTFFNTLRKDPVSNHGKPLAHNTVKRLQAVLGNALEKAVECSKLSRNPMKAVELPARDKTTRTEEMTVLDEAQLSTLLQRAEQSSIYIEILIAAKTGMRMGEVLALTWGKIDFEARTIRIDASSERTKEHGRRLKDPKTRAGIRTIRLPQSLVVPLRAHHVKQIAHRTEKGGEWNPGDYVCPTRDGRLQVSQVMSNRFSQFYRVHCPDLPRIRFHDLRHTVASQMLNRGEPIVRIAYILGHGSITTTLSTYAHLIKGADTEAIDRHDEALSAAGGL